jgi:hypothetical protein
MEFSFLGEIVIPNAVALEVGAMLRTQVPQLKRLRGGFYGLFCPGRL